MADSDKFDAFLTFLRRAHRDGIKTTEDIKADALNAAAAMVDGHDHGGNHLRRGGSARSIVNCEPSIISAACEAFLDSIDEDNPLAGADQSSRYLDLSGDASNHEPPHEGRR